MEELGRVSWNSCYISSIECSSTFYVNFREQQRAQRVFKAQQPLDLPAARNKLLGFGMQLLDGIDPNPDNMVCAGIIHTQGQQVGCLLRLEPNRQAQVSVFVVKIIGWSIDQFFSLSLSLSAQMFRLTIRSSKETVTAEVAELLVDQF